MVANLVILLILCLSFFNGLKAPLENMSEKVFRNLEIRKISLPRKCGPTVWSLLYSDNFNFNEKYNGTRSKEASRGSFTWMHSGMRIRVNFQEEFALDFMKTVGESVTNPSCFPKHYHLLSIFFFVWTWPRKFSGLVTSRPLTNVLSWLLIVLYNTMKWTDWWIISERKA